MIRQVEQADHTSSQIWNHINAGHVPAKFQTTVQRDFANVNPEEKEKLDRTFFVISQDKEYWESYGKAIGRPQK